MSERAVISARVSDDVQRSNYSIPTQLTACLEYIKEKNYTLVGDRFVDLETGQDAQSGNGAIPAYVDDFTSTELSRPMLDAAFQYLELVGFDVLVIHSLDRLARDPYIRQTLEIEFARHGARVEYIKGDYDDSPEGEVRKDLDATFAKWENAKRVERCNRGKKGKARDGKFVAGRAPYGYRMNESEPGGLAVVEDEIEVVRRIFRLFVDESESIRGVARILTYDEIPTPQGRNARWGKSTVHRVLRNTAYIGRIYYNKHRRKGKRLVVRDKSEWIEIAITPTVEEEIFEMAQKRLDHNREIRRRRPKRFYLLSGAVFCGECKRPYICQTAVAGKNRRKNDAPYYRHRKKEGHCINRQVSARWLEPKVWAEIEKLLTEPDRLRRGYEISLARQQAVHEKKRVYLETLKRGEIKLQQQMHNLTTAYIDPDIGMTKAEYVAQRAEIEKGLAEDRGKMTSLERELDQSSVVAFPELEAFVTEIHKGLDTGELTPEIKQRIINILHIKVIIELDGEVWLDGWILPSKVGRKAGFSSTTSSGYGHRRLPPPAPA